MNEQNDLDRQMMTRAIELAQQGRGAVSPNALAGAVIARNGEIIGEGYCPNREADHAECYALDAAAGSTEGATLYLNIEPCIRSRAGNSCVDRIIAAGITSVKIALEDPNPLANCKGIQKLKDAGIAVEVGLCQQEATRLNEIYLKYSLTRRPFVTLVSAMSLDGKIATYLRDSENITGSRVHEYVHRLRSEYDAVIVGINTVLQDNPQLSCKQLGSREPYRIVIDSHGKTPLNSKVFLRSGPSAPRPHVLIATTDLVSEERMMAMRHAGSEVIVCPENPAETLTPRVDINGLMHVLSKRGISSVLIEGGGTLNASALSAGVVDKVCFIIAPKIVGGMDALTPVEGPGAALMSEAMAVQNWTFEQMGEDLMIEGYLA